MLINSDLLQENLCIDNFNVLCSYLINSKPLNSNVDYPLLDLCRLRSNLGITYSNREFNYSLVKGCKDSRSEIMISMSVLTLAGADGVLPWWINEKIYDDLYEGGSELHQFLDRINRRFWELLFMTSGCGHMRHIPFVREAQFTMMDELVFAIAGIPKFSLLPEGQGNSEIIKTIRTLAYSSKNRKLDEKNLEKILEETCKRAVAVRRRKLIRVPIADKSKIHLGRCERSFLKRNNSILGNKSYIYSGLELEIFLHKYSEIIEYIPEPIGKYFSAVKNAIQVFYGQNTPVLSFRINAPFDNELSRIGSRFCRLGWGASLSNDKDTSASTVIYISGVVS